MAEGRVEKLAPNKSEIQQLWALAKRNLHDAALAGLSSEGRFEFAYNATRTLATIVIRSRGYRVKSTGGHHWTTFVALEAAMGESIVKTSAYFDQCRRKRNEALYDVADSIADTAATELLLAAKKFALLIIKKKLGFTDEKEAESFKR